MLTTGLMRADGSTAVKSPALAALDASLGGLIAEFVSLNEFSGKVVRASRQTGIGYPKKGCRVRSEAVRAFRRPLRRAGTRGPAPLRASRALAG